MPPEQSNTVFLTRTLEWFRGRLMELIDPGQASPDSMASGPEPSLDEADSLPAIATLAETFGLSEGEQLTLLLCAAPEFDPSFSSLFAAAQRDASKSYPTFSLALTLFDNLAWDVVTDHRPLRYWRMIQVHPSIGVPLTSAPLSVDERILNYLRGVNSIDRRLISQCQWPAALPHDLPPSQEAITHQIVEAATASPPAIIQLTGSDSPDKQVIAAAAAARLNAELCLLPAEMLHTDANELEQQVRLWQREIRLLPLVLYINGASLDRTATTRLSPIVRFLSQWGTFAIVDTPEPLPLSGLPTEIIAVARPTREEQAALWAEHFGRGRLPLARQLATQFQLPLPTLTQVIAKSEQSALPSQSEPDTGIWNACLAATRPSLDSLAQRIDVKASWDDLVLGDEEESLLRGISAQVRHRLTVLENWGFAARLNRGMGVSALFSGESGTGKTMAAEVLARDLNLDLYRIDLSQVVNKYIGETEKNLRRLFDAADESGVILFFDEADALFGKRSEVKDSHDRYANIETNYLLQRLESYRGLAILATNLKSSLDAAFMRRLRFVVDFPFPTASLRKQMWKRAFPSDTPREHLDLDHLAKWNLTGGSIFNIALNAAYAAASLGTAVTMENLMSAGRSEYRKLQKPINASDFVWRPRAAPPPPIAPRPSPPPASLAGVGDNCPVG